MAIVSECLVCIGTRYLTPLNEPLTRAGDDECRWGHILDCLKRDSRVGNVQGSRDVRPSRHDGPQARRIQHMIILYGFAHRFERMIINVVCLSVGGWAGRGYNGRTVKIFFYKDIHCREDDSLAAAAGDDATRQDCV